MLPVIRFLNIQVRYLLAYYILVRLYLHSLLQIVYKIVLFSEIFLILLSGFSTFLAKSYTFSALLVADSKPDVFL